MITFRTGELINLLHGVPVRLAATHEHNPPPGVTTHRLLYNDFLIALRHESPREKVINTGDGWAESYAEREWLSLMAFSRLGLVWVSFMHFDHLQRFL